MCTLCCIIISHCILTIYIVRDVITSPIIIYADYITPPSRTVFNIYGKKIYTTQNGGTEVHDINNSMITTMAMPCSCHKVFSVNNHCISITYTTQNGERKYLTCDHNYGYALFLTQTIQCQQSLNTTLPTPLRTVTVELQGYS